MPKFITECLCKIKELLQSLIDVYAPKSVSYRDCSNNTVNQNVSQVVGAYLLNNQDKELREVYDVQTVTLGGSVTPVITAPSSLQITFGSVTIAPAGSDSIVGYFTDFGTGATDIGNTPSFNFAGQPALISPARYEVKSYAIMASGNIIIISGQEFNWDGTTLTSAGSSTVVNRTYQVKRGTALQWYCSDNVNTVSGPINANNTPYTPFGTITLQEPRIRDERFDNADITMAGSSSALIPATHTVNAGNTSPIPAGARRIVIKKTSTPGTVTVNGYVLNVLNETFSISANDYDSNGRVWTLPAITITVAGGATYQRARVI